MNRTRSQRALKLSIVTFLILVISFLSASCIPSNDQNFIEELLKNAEGGKLTYVTKDGESITITLSKTTQPTVTEKTSDKTSDQKEKTEVKKEPTNCPNLSDYLPVLNCIEDVFKTLAVWEDASALKKKGLTWSHIAGELGYDSDTMYARLQEIIEEQLREAKELGFIDQEKLDYKIKYYGELALKWVGKIFAS